MCEKSCNENNDTKSLELTPFVVHDVRRRFWEYVWIRAVS